MLCCQRTDRRGGERREGGRIAAERGKIGSEEEEEDKEDKEEKKEDDNGNKGLRQKI